MDFPGTSIISGNSEHYTPSNTPFGAAVSVGLFSDQGGGYNTGPGIRGGSLLNWAFSTGTGSSLNPFWPDMGAL